MFSLCFPCFSLVVNSAESCWFSYVLQPPWKWPAGPIYRRQLGKLLLYFHSYMLYVLVWLLLLYSECFWTLWFGLCSRYDLLVVDWNTAILQAAESHLQSAVCIFGASLCDTTFGWFVGLALLPLASAECVRVADWFGLPVRWRTERWNISLAIQCDCRWLAKLQTVQLFLTMLGWKSGELCSYGIGWIPNHLVADIISKGMILCCTPTHASMCVFSILNGVLSWLAPLHALSVICFSEHARGHPFLTSLTVDCRHMSWSLRSTGAGADISYTDLLTTHHACNFLLSKHWDYQLLGSCSGHSLNST